MANDQSPKLEHFVPLPVPQSNDVVGRFLDHVSKTGDPTSFPGLCSTRPPDGSEFHWKTGVIIVPVHKSELGQLVVCPWCSPTTPKFKRGRLCWFPHEAVHRFVGWHCAKTHLDSDSMREADKRWADEQKKIRTNAFLRENCNRVEGLLKSAQKLESIATACDQFHGRFSRDHSEVYADLARYVRDGRLCIDQSLGSGARRDGSGSISVLFGVLDGFKVLKGKPSLGKRLSVTRAQLESIAVVSHKARFGELSHLDDRERHVLHVVILEAHKELVRIIRTVEEFQLFMSPKNIGILNDWCSHDLSEVYSCGIDVALHDGTLRFGYRVNGNRCTTIIRADDAMFIRPPFIDALRRGDIEKPA